MHYEILDQSRQNLLPLLSPLKERFYLAGGTALALQVGHRDSIDFDFFTTDDIDTVAMYDEIAHLLSGHDLTKTQDEKNTLSVLVDGSIRISFFTYAYPLLEPRVEEDHLSLASIPDIACMKLSAITGRAVEKDYVDLYVILKRLPLDQLLALAARKFPQLDTNLIVKSLVFFDDVVREPVTFTEGNAVSFEEVQVCMREVVREYELKKAHK